MQRAVISISELHFRALFRDTSLAHLSRLLAQSTWQLEIQVPGAGTWHQAHHQNLASWVCLKRAFKMQFRKAYFRSLVHPGQKLWPKPNSGNSFPFILSCKIGGYWNLMNERYFSKTPFLTFVYRSKCNINLPYIFGKGWLAIAKLKQLSLFISLS